MNEEILLRLGYDAAAVKRGTVAMMQGQKQAAVDFVMTWKRAFAEIDREEASRNNRARALLRQRHTERVDIFKKELALQRAATGVVKEAKNIRGVSLENLARNVVGGGAGGSGGHGFGGGMNSTAMREMVVLAREVSRGNFSRVPSSLSILIQSLGKLGTVAAAVVNPITGVIAGLAAGAATLYKLGYNATQTIRNAGNVGFSTTGYQTFLRQASRESGGAAAAQSSLETLSQNIGEMRSGDMGQMRKFRKYGIATTGANGANLSNEQIFQNALGRFEGTSDPAKRAAMGLDIFGESYKKILKTLNEGQGGFNSAMGKGVQSAGHLAVLSQVGGFIGDTSGGVWNALKRGAGSQWNAFKNNYVGYMEAVNPGLKKIDEETQRSEALAKQERDLLASGKIKPIHMSDEAFARLHPELAADRKVAQMRSDDLQSSLDDRGKLGLDELAGMGRRMTGHIRPRQYTVTSRMRTAMKIDDLEAASTNAWLRGDDAQFQKLRGEADQMRKSNPWLSMMDKDPTRKVVEQLTEANKALKDIQEMAQMVMNESQ